MAEDTITSVATSCSECEPQKPPETDPARILERLPRSLFRLDRPSEPAEQSRDIVVGDWVLDAPLGVPAENATILWDVARTIAYERDVFVWQWRVAEANQLGLGRMEVVDSAVQSECPRATGVNLDRVGAQYGVTRPAGFTDCCYWRLVLLLLFTPGPTTWLLREIAELYTGERPEIDEAPARITLLWDPTVTEGFWDAESYWDSTGWWESDPSPPTVAADTDGFWDADDSFWDHLLPGGAPGLTLEKALELVKPAGVHLVLQDVPLAGSAGCSWATARAEAGVGWWA